MGMGICATCGVSISGRGRQYCQPCAVDRKKTTNRDYWCRVAEAKPLLLCAQCGAFYKVRTGFPSLRAYCDACALAIRRENVRTYDRLRQKGGNRHKPEKSRAYTQQYKREHPEWNRQSSATYKKCHPEKVGEQTKRRRARKLQSSGDCTMPQFWKLCDGQGWLCSYCGASLTRFTATMDHIIPLARGGAHDIANIALACRSCNASKGNKLLGDWQGSNSLQKAMAIPSTVGSALLSRTICDSGGKH
jgi:5-methylcytosine-specific restriction endonuclease McrA